MQRYLQSDLNGGTTFDPDTIRILGDALDGAWRSLQTKGSTSRQGGRSKRRWEKLALRIIEMAKHSERNVTASETKPSNT
jgi:hypothetical protein